MRGLHELCGFEHLLSFTHHSLQEQFRILHTSESCASYNGIGVLYSTLSQCGKRCGKRALQQFAHTACIACRYKLLEVWIYGRHVGLSV